MKGYIAITTSIILSLLLMVVAATLGSYTLNSRFNLVDFDHKHQSLALARSCVDDALLKLANDTTYAGNETIAIDQYQCTTVSVNTSGLNFVISAKGTVSGATTNLRLTVTQATLSTVSLEELTNL